jgi:chromosomal replication initiator protein
MLDSLWKKLLHALERRVPAPAIELWFQPCRLVALDGDHLRVATPSAFARDRLLQEHISALEAAARDVLGGHPRVSLEVDDSKPLAAVPAAAGAATLPAQAPGLSARYTFDSFVVGNSNQFAQAACQAVADLPSKAYNPLFIYGGVGLGKTHLLSSIGHAIRQGRRAGGVAFVTAENFVNDLMAGLRRDQMDRFRHRYRGISTLVVDDVQFLGGKKRSQEEFAHTFNTLHALGKQIVLASDRPPHELPDTEERLRSYFASGLMADVQPPDAALRHQLVERKAAVFGLDLPPTVARHLADRSRRGGLNRKIESSSHAYGPQKPQLVLAELLEFAYAGGAGTSKHSKRRSICSR